METKETNVLGSKEPKLGDHKQVEVEMNFSEVIKIQLPFIGISLISSSPQVNCLKVTKCIFYSLGCLLLHITKGSIPVYGRPAFVTFLSQALVELFLVKYSGGSLPHWTSFFCYILYHEFFPPFLIDVCFIIVIFLWQELLFASAKEMTIVAMQSLDQQRFTVEVQSMQIDNQFPDSPHPVMLSFEESHKGKSRIFSKSKDTKLRSPNDSKNFFGATEPVLRFVAAKWRTRDVSFVSYQCINIRYYLVFTDV
jgi:hypothetical protein